MRKILPTEKLVLEHLFGQIRRYSSVFGPTFDKLCTNGSLVRKINYNQNAQALRSQQLIPKRHFQFKTNEKSSSSSNQRNSGNEKWSLKKLVLLTLTSVTLGFGSWKLLNKQSDNTVYALKSKKVRKCLSNPWKLFKADLNITMEFLFVE